MLNYIKWPILYSGHSLAEAADTLANLKACDITLVVRYSLAKMTLFL